ncbi:MAG: hypothetical protein WCD18_05250 [Thermosynechococcaceae cyanobacterium]
MSNKNNYWFPAKHYGWGWGLPATWQGWAVLGVFALLVLLGAIKVLPVYGPKAFVAYMALLCIGLVAVCWLKGEPPAWHWGGK